VRTEDIEGAAAVPTTLPEAERIDHALSRAVGPLWSRLKDVGQAVDDHVDRTADRLGLPPEGIHPAYADAAKPLLRAALSPGAVVSPQELAKADANLTSLIRGAPPTAIPVIEDFLHNTGVTAGLAPGSHRALEARLPPIRPETARDLVELRTASQKPGELTKLDARAAALIKEAPTSELLTLTRTLEDSGVIVRESGFYTWRPAAGARAMPLAVEALANRDYREETLAAALHGDPQFEEFRAESDKLIAAVQSSHPDQPGKDWASMARYGQRLAEKFSDQRTPVSTQAKTSAPGHLDDRGTTEVFQDHLLRRRENRLDADLERNYAEDVVLTSNHGTFFGRDGIRQSAAVLAKLVPTRAWVMDRLFYDKNVVYETWSAQVDGKLVTGFDAFVIKDGKIAAQTVYYGPGSLK
jgi:hypothetical protein